jgi:hypothetical protein
MTDINLWLFTLNAIALAAVFVLTFVASVFLHELGHLLVLRRHSKNAKIYFHKQEGKLKLHTGKEDDYLNLSRDELINVYRSGILLGLIPVGLFTIVNPWGLVLIIVYLGGCNSDFKKIARLNKGN